MVALIKRLAIVQVDSIYVLMMLQQQQNGLVVLNTVGKGGPPTSKTMLRFVEELVMSEVIRDVLLHYLFEGLGDVVGECNRPIIGWVALVSSLEDGSNVGQVNVVWHNSCVKGVLPELAQGRGYLVSICLQKEGVMPSGPEADQVAMSWRA